MYHQNIVSLTLPRVQLSELPLLLLFIFLPVQCACLFPQCSLNKWGLISYHLQLVLISSCPSPKILSRIKQN